MNRHMKKAGEDKTLEIMDKITYKQIKNSKEINIYMEQGNRMLGVLGYTEHSKKHAVKVAETAGRILETLGYSDREIELAKIAGYMHDIGNCVNRNDHPHSGAVMAFGILRDMGMEPEEIAIIVNAIGQHDEHTGTAVDPISAALILADKTDVRRDRVRNRVKANFDKHDRVNYAVTYSKLDIDTDKKTFRLTLELDEQMCSMIDYFEIFLQRMLMCRRAAEIFDMKFKLVTNEEKK